jgi:hypothetical protein
MVSANKLHLLVDVEHEVSLAYTVTDIPPAPRRLGAQVCAS